MKQNNVHVFWPYLLHFSDFIKIPLISCYFINCIQSYDTTDGIVLSGKTKDIFFFLRSFSFSCGFVKNCVVVGQIHQKYSYIIIECWDGAIPYKSIVKIPFQSTIYVLHTQTHPRTYNTPFREYYTSYTAFHEIFSTNTIPWILYFKYSVPWIR